MITIEKFKEDVMKLAKELGVQPKEIHFRTMKRKLASCSNKGRLTFNKSLLNESSEERYKVILHELLHLRYPNHGKMFKLLFKLHFKKFNNINDDQKVEQIIELMNSCDYA